MVRLWKITHKGNWPEQSLTVEGETLEEAVHAFQLYEEQNHSSARAKHIIKAEMIGESVKVK